MLKIFFYDSKPYDIEFFQKANKNFGYEFKFFKEKLDQETVILAKGYDVISLFVNDDANYEVIKKLKELNINLIAMRCAGYNNVDLKAAYENKIHIVRVPAYSPYAVAEHTIALMLCLNRKIHKAYLRVRELNFSINGLLGFDMYGKKVGVIGTGKIGKVVIKILKGFGVEILAYDSYPDNSFSKEMNFLYTSLDNIFKESDIITLHCPLTTETQYIINREAISKMKDGVIIINTSRGKLIDTKALIDGLKKGKIGSAGLDVYEEEEEFFFEDYSSQVLTDDILARLLTFPNVIITSHQAFFTKEALTNIATTTLQNIKDYYEGKPLVNEICYRCGNTVCRKKKEGRCF
ncbi:MAG: 2-hydroxyacid dehydrogenase [Chitinispirillaceae bacterium]|nr:2-hydroxyacid dehydrogenase [Chitinispirillaceae bacterium]